MASRDTTNLTIEDEMPDLPDEVKKWQIRFKYTDPKWKGGGHCRVKKCRYVGTLEEAQAERDHLRLYLKQGLDPDDFPRPHEQNHSVGKDSRSRKKSEEDRTFGEMVKVYRRQRKTEDLKPRTLETENDILDKRILPAIGDWVVQRVTLRDFQNLRLKWHDKYVEPDLNSPATINKWIRRMKYFVGWCSRRLGVRHACRDLKRLPAPRDKQGRAMNRQEVAALLNGVKSKYPHYYALCFMAVYTGQRFGTLCAFRWSYIDTENGVIHLKSEKTGHKAKAPLTRFRSILEEHRKILKEWSPIAFKKAPYVFPCKGDPDKLKYGGRRTDSSSLNKALRKVCREVGIEEISFHDFRRTFVTLALDSGVAPAVIKSMTGHCSEMIGHYHHQSTESKSDLIGIVMGEIEPSKSEDDSPSDSSVTASDVF